MSAAQASPRRLVAALAVLGPVLAFVVVAWPALTENSAIYDENDHLPAGYMYLARGDFRLSYDHPPLIKEIAALPLLWMHPRVSRDAEQSLVVAPRDIDALWIFGDRFLFKDNAPDPLLYRARIVVLMLGAAVVLLVGWWSGRLFGTTGGVLAAMVAALDPNLLAHSTVVTLDVGFALLFFCAVLCARAVMQRLTATRVVAAGAMMGAAFAAKHSAFALVPTMLVLGLLRAANGAPWPLGRAHAWTMRSLWARVTAVLGLACVWALIVWGVIWAVYGFRYAAAPDGGAEITIASWIDQIRELRVVSERVAAGEPVPDDATLKRIADGRPTGMPERVIAFATRTRLVPEAYIASLGYQAATTQVRLSYMLGKISLIGHRGYFPFTIAVKTPITTLVLLALALALYLRRVVLRIPPAGSDAWLDTLVLIIPTVIFLINAMRSNFNIGYRHVLPMLPFLYALVGGVASELGSWKGRRVTAAVTLAAVMLLATETLAARPYFLPFFNAAAGGARGGLRLLSDSNLDWGQTLPALRRWMADHQVERVNLCYFGTADPAAYGIRFVPLPGSYLLRVPGAGVAGYAPQSAQLPGYVAIGATNLQGTFLDPESLRQSYAFLRQKTPIAVLGGAMYVYWVERWGE